MTNDNRQVSPDESDGDSGRSVHDEKDRLHRLEKRAESQVEAGDEKKAAKLLGHLAFIHVESGRLGAAARSFERAVEVDPTRSDLLCELAKTYHQLGRFDAAFDAYATATERRHIDGRVESARELLEKMTRLEPEDVLRHAKLAELLAKLGKEERALEQLESCIDTLLNDRDDLDGFIRMAEHILGLDPEYHVLRRRTIERMLAEAGGYIRYNLNGQAKRLLETARAHCSDVPGVRKTLAELYLDSGEEEQAALEFIELAREIEPEDEEKARQYLRQASRHPAARDQLLEAAEELGFDPSAFGDSSDEENGGALHARSGIVRENITTEQSGVFERTVTATDVEPPPLPDDAVERPQGADEPDAAVTDSLLPCDDVYVGLLALLAHAEKTREPRVVRIQSAEHGILGRFWVSEGRLLPGIVADGSIYCDDLFEREDSEFADLYAETDPGDFLSVVCDFEGTWSSAELEPVQSLTARGLCRILKRGRGRELVVSEESIEIEMDPPARLSPRSLAQDAAAHLSGPGTCTAWDVFDAAVDENYEAWLTAPEEDGAESVWLPIRGTSLPWDSVAQLSEIGKALGELAGAFDSFPSDDAGGDCVLTVLKGSETTSLLVQSPDRMTVVEVPHNQLGAALRLARKVIEAGGEPETVPRASAKPPEVDTPGDSKNLRN